MAVGSRPLDARAADLIRATPGVAAVEPHVVTDVTLAGKNARIWGVAHLRPGDALRYA